MLYFSRWKTFLLLVICCGGIFFSLPNFLSKETQQKLPSWFQPANLGLDLQGGAHLLLEVDIQTIIQERLETLKESVRDVLRKGDYKIRYLGLGISNQHVHVTIPDEEDLSKARQRIREENPDASIDTEGQDLKILLSEPAQKKLIDDAVARSIEIVRKRIDELGTREPIIQRQGDYRIVVQVPGFNDPDRIKKLIGKTAKMTFHLVDHNVLPDDALAGRIPPSSELLSTDDEREPFLVVKKTYCGEWGAFN